MSAKAWTYRDCTDKRCIRGQLCRAAACGQYTIVCRALTDPDFKTGICPFYKTRLQYAEEYERTNKLSKDPYEGGGTT